MFKFAQIKRLLKLDPVELIGIQIEKFGDIFGIFYP